MYRLAHGFGWRVMGVQLGLAGAVRAQKSGWRQNNELDFTMIEIRSLLQAAAEQRRTPTGYRRTKLPTKYASEPFTRVS